MPKTGKPVSRIRLIVGTAYSPRRRRVARSVRQEHAVRIVAQHVVGAGRGGHDLDLATKCRQAAQDVSFGAEIDGDHAARRFRQRAVAMAQRPRRLFPTVALRAAHLFRQIHAFEAGPRCGRGCQGRRVERAVRRMVQPALRRAELADAAGQRAGVDAANADQSLGP